MRITHELKGNTLSSIVAQGLITALNQRGIEYAHWKSNFGLTQAAEEGSDLDFLVDRRQLPCLQALLLEQGFKAATVTSGPNPLSIYHYYGLDGETGELIHVHLFTHVLTGESLIKSHLLPFERMLLENVEQIGAMKVANRSAELVLFFVRTCIKYGSWLDLPYLLRKPEAVREELAWLRAGSDMDRACELLGAYCPVIEETLFREGLEILARPGALPAKMRLARRVRRRLRIYAKYTGLQGPQAYAQLLWQQAKRRLIRQRRSKALTAGGAVIAFVGPEATGKSTLVAESARWLGSAFVVRSIHAGKPPGTLPTLPLNALLPFLREKAPDLRPNRLEGHIPGKPAEAEKALKIEKVSALLYAVRAVAVAWDRRDLLIKARRAAARGELVICDRYPSAMIGAMDSPRPKQESAPVCLIGWPASNSAYTNRFRRPIWSSSCRFRWRPPSSAIVIASRRAKRATLTWNHAIGKCAIGNDQAPNIFTTLAPNNPCPTPFAMSSKSFGHLCNR